MVPSKFDLRVTDLCTLLADRLTSTPHTDAEAIVALLILTRVVIRSIPGHPPPAVALLILSIEDVVSEFRMTRPVEQ